MKVNKPVLFDYDYQGQTDNKGRIKEFLNKEALSQSLKLWIASMEGDIVRQDKRGGYITRWLMKPMTSVSIDAFEMSIRDGIYQDFTPHLVIQTLEIKPNFEGRYWNIYLEVYSPDYKTNAIVDEKLRARL